MKIASEISKLSYEKTSQGRLVDPKIYLCRSHCHLKKETCGQLVIEVPLQHCRTTASCNEQCSDERNFVCGSDNKIYRSECEMKRDNCG